MSLFTIHRINVYYFMKNEIGEFIYFAWIDLHYSLVSIKSGESRKNLFIFYKEIIIFCYSFHCCIIKMLKYLHFKKNLKQNVSYIGALVQVFRYKIRYKNLHSIWIYYLNWSHFNIIYFYTTFSIHSLSE